MRCLLDSHALLWFMHDDARLSRRARDVMAAADNELLFSVASYWEICIKISLGKLRLHAHWEATVAREMDRCGIRWLGLKPGHAEKIVSLPFHHRDPFDRMLVAQAQVEGLTIVSGDGQLSAYPVPVIW